MKIEIYEATNGQFYWRLRARNNRIVADGSEGYFKRGNAVRAARRVETALQYDTFGQPVPIKHL